MKSLLLFFFLFLMIGAYTQTPVLEATNIVSNITSQGIKWVVVDTVNSEVKVQILNSDLSRRNSFEVSLPPNSSYSSCVFLYDHYINPDDQFELVITYSVRTESLYNYYSSIYSETGKLIKDFEGAISLTINPFPRYVEDVPNIKKEDFKLDVWILEQNGKLIHKLYNLPLTGGTSVVSEKLQEIRSPYPNPATEHLVIPLSSSIPLQAVLSVFDGNGKLVKQLPVSVTEDFYVLDVSDLSVGVYYYDVAGMRNSFIVKR